MCEEYEADTVAETANFLLAIRAVEHRRTAVLLGGTGSHLNTQENYKSKT